MQGWQAQKLSKADLEKLNNSSIQDIKTCEEMGFPQPCVVDFVDPDFGETQFVISTIRDFAG